MANRMKFIAKMFGLGIGEHFKTDQTDYDNWFTEKTLAGSNGKYVWDDDLTLRRLLTGEYKVIKPRFKPNKYDKYYFVQNQIGFCGHAFDNETGKPILVVEEDNWLNGVEDYVRYKAGNCFETKQEAEDEKYKLYDRLTDGEFEYEQP